MNTDFESFLKSINKWFITENLEPNFKLGLNYLIRIRGDEPLRLVEFSKKEYATYHYPLIPHYSKENIISIWNKQVSSLKNSEYQNSDQYKFTTHILRCKSGTIAPIFKTLDELHSWV